MIQFNEKSTNVVFKQIPKTGSLESLSHVGCYAIVAVIAKIYVFFKGWMIYRGAITKCTQD